MPGLVTLQLAQLRVLKRQRNLYLLFRDANEGHRWLKMTMTGEGLGSAREPSAATPDQPEQDRFVAQPHEAGRNAERIHEP